MGHYLLVSEIIVKKLEESSENVNSCISFLKYKGDYYNILNGFLKKVNCSNTFVKLCSTLLDFRKLLCRYNFVVSEKDTVTANHCRITMTFSLRLAISHIFKANR